MVYQQQRLYTQRAPISCPTGSRQPLDNAAIVCSDSEGDLARGSCHLSTEMWTVPCRSQEPQSLETGPIRVEGYVCTVII